MLRRYVGLMVFVLAMVMLMPITGMTEAATAAPTGPENAPEGEMAVHGAAVLLFADVPCDHADGDPRLPGHDLWMMGGTI